MPKAQVIHELGPPEAMRWEDWPVPDPAAGEVRLRHTAVGVNFADTYHRGGISHPWPVPPSLDLRASASSKASVTASPGSRQATGSPTAFHRSAATRKSATIRRTNCFICRPVSTTARLRRCS